MQSAQNLNQIIRKNCSSGTSKNDCTPLMVQSRSIDSQNVELSMSLLIAFVTDLFLDRVNHTARPKATVNRTICRVIGFAPTQAVALLVLVCSASILCRNVGGEAAGKCDASDFSLPENEPEQPHWELPSLGFALNGHCLRHWYAPVPSLFCNSILDWVTR